ncbi:MAG: glycerol-3-phosphate 1-O-acyltransferase PlsY [Lachnospiraceae bacterium]|nr:glycerol-3-phosphate 1-O-acyltransferase PlsY [Lachnospiraceae bacterium]
MLQRIVCLAIGYVFGLFQTGFFYGKLHGIDIRQKGSGNIGTTNSLRVLGKKAALIVLLGDCFKTVFAMLLAHALFGKAAPEMDNILQLYAGLGATLGHNFPFYMNFKGGKGIAVLAGMYVSVWITDTWIPFAIGFVLFFSLFFATHLVSLASLSVSTLFFVVIVVLERIGRISVSHPAGMIELYVLAAIIMVMAFFRHKENIQRLLKGEERKTYLAHKNKVD